MRSRIVIDRLSKLDDIALVANCKCGHRARVDVQNVIDNHGDLPIVGGDLKQRLRCKVCGSRATSISLVANWGVTIGESHRKG